MKNQWVIANENSRFCGEIHLLGTSNEYSQLMFLVER